HGRRRGVRGGHLGEPRPPPGERARHAGRRGPRVPPPDAGRAAPPALGPQRLRPGAPSARRGTHRRGAEMARIGAGTRARLGRVPHGDAAAGARGVRRAPRARRVRSPVRVVAAPGGAPGAPHRGLAALPAPGAHARGTPDRTGLVRGARRGGSRAPRGARGGVRRRGPRAPLRARTQARAQAREPVAGGASPAAHRDQEVPLCDGFLRGPLRGQARAGNPEAPGAPAGHTGRDQRRGDRRQPGGGSPARRERASGGGGAWHTARVEPRPRGDAAARVECRLESVPRGGKILVVTCRGNGPLPENPKGLPVPPAPPDHLIDDFRQGWRRDEDRLRSPVTGHGSLMDLILWRHADAEDGTPDAERILTPRGEKQAKRVAEWLRGQLPDDYAVLSSPARRARQTAQALTKKLEIVEDLGAGATPKGVLKAAGWPD